MGNIFDSIQSNTFDIISNTMGYNARWNPGDGHPVKTARVLYNYPTRVSKFGDSNLESEEHSIEYKFGDFDGMKEAVNKGVPTSIEIEKDGEWKSIRVRRMQGKFDGNTHVAILNTPT